MCRPLSDFQCADCLTQLVQMPYANDTKTGHKICDKCAHRRDVDDMKRRHHAREKTYCYGPQVLMRGATIGNWPGNILGRIVSVGRAPHPFTVRSHWGKRYYCKFIDLHGNYWAGWFCEGMATTIKPIAH